MSHDIADARTTPTAPSSEGAALYEVYGRLVSIHHGLATAAPDDPDRSRRAIEKLMETMRFIDQQPSFRAATEAAEPARRARIATRRAKVAGRQ